MSRLEPKPLPGLPSATTRLGRRSQHLGGVAARMLMEDLAVANSEQVFTDTVLAHLTVHCDVIANILYNNSEHAQRALLLDEVRRRIEQVMDVLRLHNDVAGNA